MNTKEDQAAFRQQVQDLKEFMKKPNVKTFYTTKGEQEKRMMRSMSPAIGLTARP
jgi:hypothetical protein